MFDYSVTVQNRIYFLVFLFADAFFFFVLNVKKNKEFIKFLALILIIIITKEGVAYKMTLFY